MNTNDKFRQIITTLGFKNVRDFSESLDITQARLVDVMREKQKIPQDLIFTLITKHNINANWLLTGQGNMFIGSQATTQTLNPQEAALLEDYRESNAQGKEAIEKTAKALSTISALENRKVA
ncbi:helix-turn-helix domain-containing protein [Phocoenobacter skyensis]|uniref:helix-turn-helix domain-containing protein n=1 Tax=Phocoenobacter skyensis TaxID=97481 RepID=UPI002793D8F3|nr:helix-turn-helix domain-containing protein [Pasteurella skyensis]MDP8162827.1 helix-turn-helix domain-containing protein [Pasteurella skyensis]